MKITLSLLISLCLLSNTTIHIENVSVPEPIQCGARNCFNPEKWYFYHQWDRRLIPDYVGYDIGCENKPIKIISSIIKGKSYDSDWLFQYDKQNHLLLQQSNFSSGNNYKIILQYNSKGKPIYINDDNKISTIEYPVPGESLLKNDKIITKTKIEGNTIISTTTNQSGIFDSKTIRIFDTQKRLLSKSDSFAYNNSRTIFTYHYNEKGLVDKFVSNYGKDIYTSYREYNDYGWIVLDSTIINPKSTIVAHYQYDLTSEAESMTIKQYRLYSDSSGSPISYSFDKWGNWIEKKEYSNLLPIRTETRKITYW